MKHFVCQDIPIYKIAGEGVFNPKADDVNEALCDIRMDWNLTSHFWEYRKDTLYGHYSDFEGSIPKHLTTEERVIFKDELEEDYLRAISDAYANNYEAGAYEYLKDHCETLVPDLCDFYYTTYKGEKCEFYEAYYIRITMTEKNFREMVLPEKEYNTWGYLYEDRYYQFEQYLDSEHPYKGVEINWEHLDYHGCRFDSEGWEDYYSDYSETSYLVEKRRKSTYHKIKGFIKNKVPLYIREKELAL